MCVWRERPCIDYDEIKMERANDGLRIYRDRASGQFK